ncbi:MAG: SPASM domain-containing protein [Peptococcaceae bacterium]|nr:SPASM domain-containing protein [Peptococcaceae bacterium]
MLIDSITNYPIGANVHIYRQGGLNIAYDVNSGSLHLLDDLTFALIGEWIAYQKAYPQSLERPEEMIAATGQDLPEGAKADILHELAGLQEQQILFSKPVSEGTRGRAGSKRDSEWQESERDTDKRIKAICLHVAHDCNLRCGYCFAGTGDFGGARGMMSLDVGKKALDFIFQACGERPHCEVDFFGGEPLLNWPVVRDLVLYGRELEEKTGKTAKFTMTTNAVLFTEEVQDFVEKEHISVVFSLDGRPEVHDRMRPFPDGSGSYRIIADRVSAWMRNHKETSRYATGTYAYVRGTYTRHNLDFDRDVMHLAGLGIERISLEPVVAPATVTASGSLASSSGAVSSGASSSGAVLSGTASSGAASPSGTASSGAVCDYALTHKDIDVLGESYDRLGEEARKGGFTFFHFNAGLAGVCLPKRVSGCGAGTEYLAVSPEGDLYPCHQFVGKEAFCMGSLMNGADNAQGDSWENVVRNPAATKLADQFRQANIYGKAACRMCWARFSCSGGCHASNVTHGGSLFDVYELGCVLQKKRLEVAYYLQIRETLQLSMD